MEKDIIVTCPYNKAHRIRRFKLMTHIAKCKKQHSTTNKVACPLDSGHIVDPNAIRDHLSSCSNLSCLIKNDIDEKIDAAPVMNADTHKPVENWEELPEVSTYDAMTNAASRKVIRCVNGLTKSERAKFRISERDRFLKLNKDSPTAVRTPTLSEEETIHEMAMRPPNDITQTEKNTKKVSQQVFNKSAPKQDLNASLNKSATTSEFRDIFQKTLYNELLPDCKPDESWKDSTFISNESEYVKSKDCIKTNNTLQKLMEHSVTNNDMLYKSFNYPGPSGMSSERESRKEKSFLLADQNEEVKDKKQENVTEVNTSCDIFDVNTSRKKIEHTENTWNIKNEQVTDKLLAILMNKTENIKLGEKTKENDEKDMKYENNPNLALENIIAKLKDQVDHLTKAQNDTAEQNARLVKEMNDLKQRYSNTHFVPLNNPRCAANLAEPMSPLYRTHPKNHNVSGEIPTFLGNMPSSYNDMFNLRDNSEVLELKTPKDFSHC